MNDRLRTFAQIASHRASAAYHRAAAEAAEAAAAHLEAAMAWEDVAAQEDKDGAVGEAERLLDDHS